MIKEKFKKSFLQERISNSKEEIKKPVTIKEFEEVLSQKYTISDELTTRNYIFPDGKNLVLHSYETHADVLHWLIKNNYVEEYEGIYDGGCPPIENLGCIRVNLATEGFIMLSKVESTAKQYDVLLKLLDEFSWRKSVWKYGSDLMILEPHQKSDYRKFSLTTNTNDDIINIIKNYYRTGRLVESFSTSKLSNIEALYDLSMLNENDESEDAEREYTLYDILTVDDVLKSAEELNTLATIDECDGPVYLSPDGSVIKVNKNWDSEYGSAVHTNYLWYIFYQTLKRKNIKEDAVENIDEEQLLKWIEMSLGFIRCNCGNSSTDKRSYIDFNHSKRPTEAQYKNIEDFLYRIIDLKRNEILVYFSDVGSWVDTKKYSLKDNLPEEIVAKIKRGFTTGQLVETDLNEEYVDEDKLIYTTQSEYEVASIVKSSKRSLRILWDRKLKRFFICDVDDFIHSEMVVKALETGYYGNMRKWELSNYLDDFGKNVIYYIYAPKGKENETYGSDINEDGYEGKYVYDFGTMTTRSDDRYKASPLAKALGKYKSHYVQDGWLNDDTPKIVLVSSLKESSENSVDLDSQNNELSAEQVKFFQSSVVRDENNRLLVVYHGTHSQFTDEVFTSPINWFTPAKTYANEFGNWTHKDSKKGHTYACYLNCKNLFDCGLTDGRIFSLLLTTPLTFSAEFNNIIKKLSFNENDEKMLRELISKIAVENNKDNESQFKVEYRMKIHSLTRDKRFKDILVSKGYDGMKCIENTNAVTFGVFDSSDIKSIDNKNPTSSKNIRK